MLPKNSEILSTSEYRKSTVDGEVVEIDMSLDIEDQYIKNLKQRANLNAKTGIGLDDIALLMLKDVIDPPSPSYAKKDSNGNIKTFSCIEKLENAIHNKMDVGIHEMLPKFQDK